jgi:acyl-coenzyme A thioesterase PaaI-like protein
MTWHNDVAAQQIRATVTIPDHFNGYPGFVHGGIIASVLDETAGRALLLDGDYDNLMVTLKLEVRYRRPTPTGWVIKQSASRARAAAEIRLADGTVTAQGEALLVRPSAEFFQRWEPEKPFWRVYED